MLFGLQTVALAAFVYLVCHYCLNRCVCSIFDACIKHTGFLLEHAKQYPFCSK